MEDWKETFLKAFNYAFSVVLIKEDKQLHFSLQIGLFFYHLLNTLFIIHLL